MSSPLWLLRRWFLNNFLKVYPLCYHGNLSNSAIRTIFIWIVEDYSRNISVEKKSKYLQWDRKNCHFSLFPLQDSGNYKLPYQPEFLSDWNKKHNYSFPPSIDAICEIWKESASEEKSFENVAGRMMQDGRWMPAYTISSPMSLWLRWAKNTPKCMSLMTAANIC